MTIFEISPEDIERLNDTDLRTLVGYLAEQEVRLLGHSPASVTYGGDQRAKDGGIDVRVELDGAAISGYVPRTNTGFQVKAENMARAEIISEMRPKDSLRPSIIELGKCGGAYIIVSSRGAASDTALSTRKNAMATAIADTPDAAGLHLEFYDRRRMASWVNQHPGLIPWVRNQVGRPLSGWRPHADWSSSPGGSDEEYLLGPGVRLVGTQMADRDGLSGEDGINRLRVILGTPKGIVRLVGLSGVGKTRFVQALFDERIGMAPLSRHLAVYTDVADSPDPSPLDLLARLIDLRQQCVLIIDNCGVELHQKLSARLRGSSSLVGLITVEYDVTDDEPEGTEVFKLEPSTSEIIEKIVARRYPDLTNPEIGTIAAFSEGNSRIALALASTAEHGESLANLKDSELFKRLFRQKNEDDPALLRAAKALSLVYSFDGETLEGEEAELPVLASLAGQTVSELHAHVAELHRRQLVQKRGRWRALLPHALAHRLARQALEEIHPDIVHEQFACRARERLIKSFTRRLGCLHDSPAAQKVVAMWLQPDGWLWQTDNLSPFDLVVFDNIAPIDPDAILVAIQRAADALAKTEPRKELPGKMIQILRSLAYDPRLFDKAVTLIGDSANPAEDSNNSADAVNVFSSLFHIFLSGTQALPEQRAAFLRQMAGSAAQIDRLLAFRGLKGMLEHGHFSSSYGFEFGTRKRDYGYHPGTDAERLNWFKVALDLCAEMAQKPLLRTDVRTLFADEFSGLAGIGLVDETIVIADGFAADGGWPEGWAGVRKAYGEAKAAQRKIEASKLKTLAERLRPTTLSERIVSYVLPEEWSTLDVAASEVDDPQKYEKARAAVRTVCVDVGKELAAAPVMLTEHLPSLLESPSLGVWTVGTALGQEEVGSPEDGWRTIVAAFSDRPNGRRQATLLEGFIHGLAGRDRALAEKLLDEALDTQDLHRYFVRLQAMAGIDDIGCDRLIKATAFPTIPTWTFSNLQMGCLCDGLPGARFRQLLLTIADREDGLDVALDIMQMRAFSLRSQGKGLDPDDRATGRDLLSKVTFSKYRNSEGYKLAEIAKACLTTASDHAAAETLCSNLLAATEAGKVHASDYGELIGVLAASFPRAVLDVLVDRRQAGDEGRRDIFRSFRNHDRRCPLANVDDETMLSWAQEDPDRRFIYLAEAIRPWRKADGSENHNEPGPLVWSETALRLVRESHDPILVLSTYFRRFRPSIWMGSLADLLESKLPLLRELSRDPNPLIARWADQAVGPLAAEVESARAWEGKQDRQRDEQFPW